jgi:hypothetical protein
VNSVPDDHQPHHDPTSVTLAALRKRYGDWEILIHLDNAIVSAEHRSGDGRTVRYIVAESVSELAGKLATASVVEP